MKRLQTLQVNVFFLLLRWCPKCCWTRWKYVLLDHWKKHNNMSSQTGPELCTIKSLTTNYLTFEWRIYSHPSHSTADVIKLYLHV